MKKLSKILSYWSKTTSEEN